MTTPRTLELVASTVESRSALKPLQLASEEHLYRLVPRLNDRDLRWAAIQLRRDVHSGNLPGIEKENLFRILDQLPEQARDDVQACLETISRIAQLSGLGQSILEEEIRSTLRPGLWSAIDDHRFKLGVAAASPDFSDRLDLERNRQEGPPNATKLELALLRYVLRATCKTSPFSTFMDVGSVPVRCDTQDDDPSLAQTRRAVCLRVNRGILARLYGATTRALAHKQDGALRPNPTMRTDSRGRVIALVGELVALLGGPWRQERVARFRIQQSLKGILLNLPPSFSMVWLLQRLEGVGLTRQQACRFADKLIERELIFPPALLDAFVAEPLAEIDLRLQPSNSSEPQADFGWIGELQEASAAARNSGSEKRSEMDRQVRGLEKRTLEQLRFGVYDAYRNAFFEESRLEGIDGNVNRRHHDLICEVGDFLRDQVALRPEYLRLRRAFRERYGASGVCTELVRFLCEEAGSFVNLPEWDDDMRPSATAEPEVLAQPGTRIGLTAFVQIAANPTEEDVSGDIIVVNRVYEGVGWLSARHATGDGPDSIKLRQQIERWLEDAYAPAEPIDLPLSGHCNDLQAHPRVTRRVLWWPGEPLREDRHDILPASDVVLRLNPKTGLFEFFDDRGRLVAPVYLGSILPVPTWGPVFGLTVLARPVELLRPSPATPAAGQSAVTFYSRRVHGRIVLTRACWSVSTSYLRESCFNARGFLRLVKFVEFCEARRIPKVFFARAERWLDPLRKDSLINALKPTFIDISNPFCLDLLERLARDADTIVLTEVLPAHAQAWRVANGERHVTELQVEMCISATG